MVGDSESTQSDLTMSSEEDGRTLLELRKSKKDARRDKRRRKSAELAKRERKVSASRKTRDYSSDSV